MKVLATRKRKRCQINEERKLENASSSKIMQQLVIYVCARACVYGSKTVFEWKEKKTITSKVTPIPITWAHHPYQDNQDKRRKSPN